MTRPSRKGGKTSEAKARNASPAKGRKTTKTKRRIAPAGTRAKRRPVSGPSEELKEAREQQAATAEILKVIASSPDDVQPVVEAVAERAMSLLDAWSVVVTRFDGELLLFGAARGALPDTEQFLRNQLPQRPEAAGFGGRSILERSAINVSDALADPSPQIRDRARMRGFRAALSVPMLRDGQSIGAITVTRRETGAFAANEIELLQTFADQAVIAIENVRQFNETKEALERQTATADILKVIARSPSEVQPVFEAIAESAARLCKAEFCNVFRFDGELIHFMHSYGYSREAIEDLRHFYPMRPGRGSCAGRAILNGKVEQVPDVRADPEYTQGNVPDIMKISSVIAVPMLKEHRPVGAIAIIRAAKGTFPQRQIDLLKTFADQAVIAIENVRLFEEVQAKTRDLTETLTYQTGSGNILNVIASSPTDIEPVLNAIVEGACELCEANDAAVLLKDGEHLRFRAHHGPIDINLEKWPITRGWTVGRAFLDGKPVHLRDTQSEEAKEFPDSRALSAPPYTNFSVRTVLSVPLLRESERVGAILLRRIEMRPFSDKQIALLQTFADQAVIAINNARLFDEVQAKTRDLTESLQQQTATADVLKVISRSVFDLPPVLETLISSACRLCEADLGAVRYQDGSTYRVAADYGFNPGWRDHLARQSAEPDRGSIFGRTVVDGRTVHISDVLADPEYTRLATQQLMGFRAALGVPLVREGRVFGVLNLFRFAPRAFTEKQIELVETFADQAVIAIENTRLFNEVRQRTEDLAESLQQQTATSEILSVISSSPGDLAPVFDAMLSKAMDLCSANFGVLNTFDGKLFSTSATFGLPPAYDQYRRGRTLDYGPGTAPYRLLEGEPYVEFVDLLESEVYRAGEPNRRALVDIGGARSLLAVPLLKDERVVGNVMIFRQDPLRYSDKQIALLKQFAAQAVIAIENARLLNELRQRTDDLTESLHDLRTAQDRLIQTEKLASLGQLTAGIAHEIKNPLNFVNNFSALSADLVGEMNDVLAEAPLDRKSRGELDELARMLKSNLEKVVHHGKRADSIVKNMLLHSREGSGEHRLADINALVDESLNLAYHGARAEKPNFNVTMQRSFDPTVGTADVYPQEITRVLLNLISNGFYATAKRKAEAGDGYEPTVTATTKDLGDNVEIRIRDNGTGIPDEVKVKIFNPFFTTKPAGEGTGLGLSMSHDIIVKQHGGKIDLETKPGQFTEFKIVLPRTNNLTNKI